MTTLQEASRIYKGLQKGSSTFGAWQTLPGTNVARAIARSGVDWICIDCEHGNIADSEMHELIMAIAKEGVSPIVRVAANEAWMVKSEYKEEILDKIHLGALDAGAHGLIVPLIYTVEDARRLVSSAKFPPVGTRGYGSPFTTQAFNNELGSHYLQNANDALITILQIETKSALDSVREIAAVPGVDCLLIGPYDLGNNIGHPILDGVMHEELHAAIGKIKDAARAEGKKIAIFCSSGEQAKVYAEQGFDMVNIALDTFVVTQGFAKALSVANSKI